MSQSSQVPVEKSHLLLSAIAAQFSFSAERLPAQCIEHALCPELSSCHCTAEALAGWGAHGRPGFDPDPDPDPEPEQPWQPTGPLAVVQKDPESHTSKPKQRSTLWEASPEMVDFYFTTMNMKHLVSACLTFFFLEPPWAWA